MNCCVVFVRDKLIKEFTRVRRLYSEVWFKKLVKFSVVWAPHPTHAPIGRDQPNSRFHGREIFRKIGFLS